MRYNTYILHYFIAATLLLAVAACTDGIGEQAAEAEGDFRIKATVCNRITTRGIPDGKITQGNTYRFSYPQKTGIYATVPCTFTDGTGLATADDGHFLTWADITDYQSKYTFYLDNIPSSGQAATGGVIFTEKESTITYAAGIDNEEATNDILWGSHTLDSRESVGLDFKLYHRMARLSVCVFSDNEQELKNATVALDQVVLHPQSFNRLTGEVSIDKDAPQYAPIMLRDNTEEWTGTATQEPADPDKPDETITRYKYETPAFILPPQSLREGEDRPRIRITIPESAGEQYAGTYSAVLPTAMRVTTDDGITSMQTLRFTTGQHLTLNVTLLHDNEKPPLEFRPAVVEPWKYIDRFVASADEEGIYKLADLQKLITLYNKLKSGNKEKDWKREVDRYGKPEQNGTWTFNLFNNLTFTIEESTELFQDSEFTFNMFGHSVTIGDETFEDKNKEELIQKLTKQPTTN